MLMRSPPSLLVMPPRCVPVLHSQPQLQTSSAKPLCLVLVKSEASVPQHTRREAFEEQVLMLYLLRRSS